MMEDVTQNILDAPAVQRVMEIQYELWEEAVLLNRLRKARTPSANEKITDFFTSVAACVQGKPIYARVTAVCFLILCIPFVCVGGICFLAVTFLGELADFRGDSISSDRSRRRTGAPPNAEFLFYLFMDGKKCDALVGDLEERYKLVHKKFGARRANFWYWTQAMRSVGPIAWAWVKKIVMKPAVAAITWAAAKHLLKDGSWLVMMAEVWKRIRL